MIDTIQEHWFVSFLLLMTGFIISQCLDRKERIRYTPKYKIGDKVLISKSDCTFPLARTVSGVAVGVGGSFGRTGFSAAYIFKEDPKDIRWTHEDAFLMKITERDNRAFEDLLAEQKKYMEIEAKKTETLTTAVQKEQQEKEPSEQDRLSEILE